MHRDDAPTAIAAGRTTRRRNEPLGLGLLRAACDVVAFLGAFATSYRLYAAIIDAHVIDRSPPPFRAYLHVALLFTAIALCVFFRLGLYGRRGGMLNLWEQATALKGVLLTAAWLFALLFFLKQEDYSRLVVVGAIAASMPFVIFERRLLAGAIGALQLRGHLGRHVVIFDGGSTGRLVMKKIVQAPHSGYRIVGFLDDRLAIASTVTCRITQTGPALFQAPVLGRWEQWREVVRQHRVDELLMTAPAATPERLREVLKEARALGVRVGVVPQLAELRVDQLRVEDLSAIPVLRQSSPSANRLYAFTSRLLDGVGALLLGVIAAPLLLASAIAVRLDSPGPALFVQERVGLNGRRFRMVKFRTMWTSASPYAASPIGDVDPRITRVGALLRTTGLDELPQLWNVLMGDMSLVGPRPEMPYIAERYSDLEWQRLQVRPGITGIWQLSADRHADIHENVEYDLYYISHRSTTVDVLILVETVFFTLGQLARVVRRGTRSGPPAPVATVSEVENDSYVAVALDQRASGSLPEHWRQFAPAVHALSARWPVKVLAADSNVASIDALLSPAVARLGARGRTIEFVPYVGRSELRALVAGARLVLTDLAHVAAWGAENRRDVVLIQDDTLRSFPSADPPEEMLRTVADALPAGGACARATPSAAAAAGRRDWRPAPAVVPYADLRRPDPPLHEDRSA